MPRDLIKAIEILGASKFVHENRIKSGLEDEYDLLYVDAVNTVIEFICDVLHLIIKDKEVK